MPKSRKKTNEKKAKERLERKRRALALFVVLFALWPGVHFGLVQSFGLNPWNWFGWAMYTQPVERIQARAFSPSGAALSYEGLSAEEVAYIQETFLEWSLPYITVDARSAPEPLARAILEVRRDWEGVSVQVDRLGLERESATVELRESQTFTYRREDL